MKRKHNNIVLSFLIAASAFPPEAYAFADLFPNDGKSVSSGSSHRIRAGEFFKPSRAEIQNALQHALQHHKRDDAQYVVVDDPGAGYALGQGTFLFGANDAGAVVGYYDNGETNSFERTPDGNYATISKAKTGSVALDVNSKGTIVGEIGFYSNGETKDCPAFIAKQKGNLKKFEPPDMEQGCQEFVYTINSKSAIVGDYQPTKGPHVGFVRAKDGTITAISVPGASITYATDINDNGFIAGPYYDGTGVHGYIRSPNGTITTFDPPASATDGEIASRINNLGEVQGDYADTNGVYHSLIREPDGSITVYDAPDAGNGAGQGTSGYGHININGTCAGYYLDANDIAHAYVRLKDGTLTEFDPPGSIWTVAWDINDDGAVIGTFMDEYANFHGFIRIP